MKVDFPAPGTPVMPMRTDFPACGRHLLRLGIVVGVAAFYQGDGLRKRRDVALKNALDVLFGGECTLFLSDEIGIDYGLVFHTFGYGQGALVVGVGILFFVMVYLGE